MPRIPFSRWDISDENFGFTCLCEIANFSLKIQLIAYLSFWCVGDTVILYNCPIMAICGKRSKIILFLHATLSRIPYTFYKQFHSAKKTLDQETAKKNEIPRHFRKKKTEGTKKIIPSAAMRSGFYIERTDPNREGAGLFGFALDVCRFRKALPLYDGISANGGVVDIESATPACFAKAASRREKREIRKEKIT